MRSEITARYLVGSALERQDWRDVDVRFIMSDEEFRKQFPGVAHIENASWEHDPKWLVAHRLYRAVVEGANRLCRWIFRFNRKTSPTLGMTSSVLRSAWRLR